MGILLHNLRRLEGLRENQADGRQLHCQDRRLRNNIISEAGTMIYIQRAQEEICAFFSVRNEPLLCHTRAVMTCRQLRHGFEGTRRQLHYGTRRQLQYGFEGTRCQLHYGFRGRTVMTRRQLYGLRVTRCHDAPSASAWLQGDALS